MKDWLVLALSASLIWGLWGFLGKIASKTIESQNLLIISSLGSAIALPITLLLFHKYFNFPINSSPHYVALVSGFLGGIGALFFFLAISKGDASKVVVITAMYPVVTILLSFIFLKEPMSLEKVLGIGLAIAAVIILAK